MEESQNAIFEQKKSPEGVKGWLLFFCISLTLLSPFFVVRVIVDYWRELSPVFYLLGQVKLFVIIETIVNGAIVIYSVNAGIQLWTRRKNAVTMAKNFLVFSLIGRIFITLYEFIIVATTVGLDVETGPGLVVDSLAGIGGALIYFFLWRSYLKNSQRVHLTYKLEPQIESSSPA